MYRKLLSNSSQSIAFCKQKNSLSIGSADSACSSSSKGRKPNKCNQSGIKMLSFFSDFRLSEIVKDLKKVVKEGKERMGHEMT